MAKQKKKFDIKTPRKTSYVQAANGGKVTSTLEWNDGFESGMEKSFENAQAYVDHQCIQRMGPETPRRSGVLIKAATIGTVIGSGEINQSTPYARRQYYEHKEKSYWFERMKNRHKDSILKGAAKYVKSH